MNRRFHPEFETDLISAARYYEAQRSNLGHEFLTTAETTVELIMAAPLRWPQRQAGIRRLQLERFPFVIRYRIVADTVQFLSILHAARHPDAGNKRD
ncbi:type II toxin-antitoxin system RelE/ParE family toxin [Synoicihabitans lomoniglobus]|uniref:Type II toxin-antitoxin system RelE/ParE family toxin n=1 Tax=Synoicihabitans lomoniglobus TaxID=2909285 RepID=A0AAF0CN90_9BACT|nr:type II toxin-antitoxin system RelE/ParE family toxin [Opitutaceae bacterium LMO-M01]WED64296.1 type II toxin-antitoxin system RelE/ParE family toxin [Opitutaceae bacterium LMO-M01]